MPKLSANYLTVNPDGTVGAQFAGGVAIVGDSDPTYTYSAPRTQKSVSWHRNTPAGALLAAVSVGDLSAGTHTELNATAQTSDGVNRASLIAFADSVAGQHAGVMALATGSGSPGERRRLLLDDNGKSDFNLPGGYAATFQGPWANTPPAAGAGAAFNLTNPGTYIYWVQASGYTTIGAEYVAVELWIDGGSRDQTRIYCNPLNTHIATVARVGMAPFAAGAHTVYFRIVGGTSDNFDWGAFAMVRLSD